MRKQADFDADLTADVVAFKMGFEAGVESMQLELTRAQWDANYWYQRAIDPEAHRQLMRGILADAAEGHARTRQRERWAALDRAENERQAALDKAGAR